jgi:TRAP-type C4-dicarboxylate transport system permease small subunit
MEKLARALVWLDNLVLKITLFLCGTLLLAMVAVAGLGVIFRFVLHNSLSWSDELASYLFVWLTCLGAAAGVKMRAHPEVRALADRCPAGAARLLADLTDCAVLALGAVLALYGGNMLELMGVETAASLPISMVYPYLAIPLAGGLMVFHSVVRIAVAHLDPAEHARLTLAHGASEHM